MNVQRFAAIDIGSNSVRLLIEQVVHHDDELHFNKNTLVRLPVRLGEESFDERRISPGTMDRLAEAMIAFRSIMKVHDVLHFKACATAAMREAENAKEVVEYVRKKAGIDIEVISGTQEAKTINESQKAYALQLAKNCLFVDVGGGSTETVVFIDGHSTAEQSFQIGTLRLLKDKVKKTEWKSMKEWLKKKTSLHSKLCLVGSGGNINRLFKMSEQAPGTAMSIHTLRHLVEELQKLTVDERIEHYGLSADRADVIVPAGGIFLSIMLWMGADKVYVPKIGLSDGLVKQVYAEYCATLH